MSDTEKSIADYYTSDSLWQRLSAALASDGVDPLNPSLQALAPYDHFHGRGLEATQSLAVGLEIAPSDRILDVGSGIGGPARFFADKFGCHVTGLDLTQEFCDVAIRLNQLLKVEARVTIEQGNALSMPFPDQSFDGAYSMNVAMNIEDKAALYRELHRVLKPGAWLMLCEIADNADGNGTLEYPTPWAKTAASSFLASAAQTRTSLEQNGFTVNRLDDTSAAAAAYGARSRELVGRGEKPLHRAVTLIHQDVAKAVSANSARGVEQGIIVPIEAYCIRRND
ncbi:MAG: ubiquinone/menaquinone biosynthesis C-methylase UbiE [Gammaproteobacteria bacterium]|jgi:ubiquinone/menaquinone biosynthesis C-methylase UbiE